MTAPYLSPADASPPSEREWEKLVNLVSDGCVVPVIGSGLLVTPKDGQDEPLYELWGELVAKQVGLATTNESHAHSLYEVTNLLSQSKTPNDLAYEVDDVVRHGSWPIPEPLEKLAEISGFSLYVTTTVDHLLKDALERAMLKNIRAKQSIQEIVFIPHGQKDQVDLPADFADTRSLGLFYLFGASSRVARQFAMTEDDLIEFSWSLLDRQYSPENLYDYLKEKSVLLLGCNFPDWLGRFFIHALDQGRHDAKINIYYISGHCDAGLADYLKRRHAHVLTGQTPIAFVDELHKRWLLKRHTPLGTGGQGRASDEPPKFKGGAVFISYASEDRDAVRKIRDQLEAAHIDTWMDERALEPGEEFEQVIHDNLRNASFFIAIISRSIDQAGPRRFFLKEWKWAEKAAEERHKDDCYLQPLAIDDTPPSASFVDTPYRNLHWTRLRDGRLPQDFIEYLAHGIRSFRRSR